MTMPERPRLLIVDDEEAILETMTFTFEDEYEVLTAADAETALRTLDEKAPVAVVLTDQRMPGMTGVEFLAHVYQRHPTTARMILTGFADLEAIIQAINDGHVYAYITKPWEPDQLKQVVKHAVDHHRLALENQKLVEDLKQANGLLEAVMDELGTGALAVDGEGSVRAANRPLREYLKLRGDPVGKALDEVLAPEHLVTLRNAVTQLAAGAEPRFEEIDLVRDAGYLHLRVSAKSLRGERGELGRVILLREVSHEPLRRRLDALVRQALQTETTLRESLESSLPALRTLTQEVRASGVESPDMLEVTEQVVRAQAAIEHWLEVDAAMTKERYPDAKLLLHRMQVALARWPYPQEIPERVRELARRVQNYYDSGVNSGVSSL